MKSIGNFFWCILVGWLLALSNFITGLICCITIILIPVGLQMFKLAKLSFLPFGKEVRWVKTDGKMLLNVIWAILFGWESALAYVFIGLLLCATVVLIPAGLQLFKMAKLMLLPIGAEVAEK